ncbi:hypothetical protein [Maridesulfovibrio sp.]|uniref:hypothetical protein n=1 Tax=Maridesulfovibrio sp. TaxID=2795000 RepID=UPI0029F48B66|nr:hypothetical protein [Maridesulfovibrio sp.]
MAKSETLEAMPRDFGCSISLESSYASYVERRMKLVATKLVELKPNFLAGKNILLLPAWESL